MKDKDLEMVVLELRGIKQALINILQVLNK